MRSLAETASAKLELAACVVATHRKAGLRIVTAESCTGGLLAGALTSIPGSSEVLDCGFVAYSNQSKVDLLHVPPDLISRHGAVSAEVAQAMIEGALAVSHAQCAVSITGIAGPGGSPCKPEGLVFIGTARRDQLPISHRFEFGPRGRAMVREVSVQHALKLLLQLGDVHD